MVEAPAALRKDWPALATILRCDHCGSPVDKREYAQRACAQCGSMLVPPVPILVAPPRPALPEPLPTIPAANPAIGLIAGIAMTTVIGAGAAFYLAIRPPTIAEPPPTPVAARAPVPTVQPPVTAAAEKPSPSPRTTPPAATATTRTTPQKSVKTDTCAQAAAACAEDPRGTRCSTLQAKCTP